MSHDGEIVCRVPAELAAEYADWTECAAFRIAKLDDGTYEVQVTRDLELLTRPEHEEAHRG